MKNTIKITVNQYEYDEYAQILIERGFKQIGHRLFEDSKSYVRFYINRQ